MNSFELIKVAYNQLIANKLRSFLTILGIILGVWFVISVVTFMDSFSANLLNSSAGLGPDVFQIDQYPRNMSRQDRFKKYKRIEVETAQRLMEKCDHVEIAAAEDSKNPVAVHYNERKTNEVFAFYGAQKGFFHNNNWPIKEGREITNDDNLSERYVAVIGYSIVKELFFDRNPIGEEIRVDGKSYKVIGVCEEQGTQFGNDRDTFVAIPLSTLHREYGNMQVRITIKATSLLERDQAIDEVKNEMRLINKTPAGEPDDFGLWTNESNAEDIINVLQITTSAGAFLGIIALFVGGIGVMNIMLASVKERTREIGVRKSLGATKNNILYQFLFESSFLCLIGCIFGIIFGVLTGIIVSILSGSEPVYPILAIVVSVLSSILIGVGFGSYPAWKAAQLDPIEALRYE